MKKFIIITVIFTLGICLLFGAARQRVYMQKLVNDFGDLNNGLLLDVNNTSTQPSNPNYILSAYVTVRPTEIISTLTHPNIAIRIFKTGNGTTVPFTTCAFLQFNAFQTDWSAGEVVHFDITHIPSGHIGFWEVTIPDNTTFAFGFNQQINPIPQVVAPPWNILTITSDPTGQPVAVDGAVIPEAVTPYEIHHPVVGSVYTISNPAYIWNPASFTVPADFTYDTVNFVGTPAPTDQYTLTVKAYKDGIDQTDVTVLCDGEEIGITFVPIVKNSLDEIIGVYSLSGGVVGGQFWDPPTITVTEADFTPSPGGKGIKSAGFGKKNDTKADYAAEITFQMKTTYTLTINGPAEAATVGATEVTGPLGTVVGNIPTLTIVDNDDNENDLIGHYTIAALPTDLAPFTAAGLTYRKHWEVNPINVTEDLFDADVASITFQWRDYLARWDMECDYPGTRLFFIPTGIDEIEDYGELPLTLYYHGTKENWGEWKDPDEGIYKLGDEDGPDPDDPPIDNPGPSGGDKSSQILTICSIPDNQPIMVDGIVSDPPVLTTAYYPDPEPGTIFAIDNPSYSWDPASYEVPDPFVSTTITFVGTIIDHWTLTVTAYKGTEEQHDVPVLRNDNPIGSTFVPITVTDIDDIIGDYSLPHITTMANYEFWYPPTITVDASTFSGGKGTGAELKAVKSGSKNGPKTDYTATINFDMRAKYQILVLGSIGHVVTLPDGSLYTIPPYEYFMIDDNDLINDLCGDYTIQDPPSGYAWNENPIVVTPDMFDEDGICVIEFVLHYSPPLPVELTSFTALLTDQFYVQITWISQSETNLLGYRVYRSEENSLDNAILITPTMIQATNTSQEHSYTIEDREVENHSTYYYWLESVDFNNSQFYGPVSVIVEGNVPPVLPEVTTLKSAYPNPFRANNSTNIEVSIKAGERGTLTIYNIMGQVVKTYSVAEGNHIIPWNGKDSQGNNCGSGIYFYKLTTPSLNQTKKMVIVK
jgi:hypothetical protein